MGQAARRGKGELRPAAPRLPPGLKTRLPALQRPLRQRDPGPDQQKTRRRQKADPDIADQVPDQPGAMLYLPLLRRD